MKEKNLPYLLPLRSVIFLLVFVLGSMLVGKDVSDISNWWSLVASLVNIFVIGLLLYSAKKNKKSFSELINYEKGKTKPKQIIAISLMMIFVSGAFMMIAGFLCFGEFPYMAPMMIEPVPKVPALANVLILPVSTALAEDGLYLGCGVNHINNKKAAVLVPAFFYALQHCFIPTIFDGKYILYRFLCFLPLTIILCLYYYKKRNPLPVMVGHAILDLATAMQILATSFVPGLYEKMCGG